jgi:hypothetical protein
VTNSDADGSHGKQPPLPTALGSPSSTEQKEEESATVSAPSTLQSASARKVSDVDAVDFLTKASSQSLSAYAADCGSIEEAPSDLERMSGMTASSPHVSRTLLSRRLSRSGSQK